MKRVIYSIITLCLISIALISINNSSEDLYKDITLYLEYLLSTPVSFLGFLFLGGEYEIFGETRSITIFGLPILVAWLIAGSIFFTFKLRFVNIRLFSHAIEIARGRYEEKDAPGKISQLQALFAATAATVGLGNIAGVAIAVSIGGPGAVIWMMIAAFFAMSLKCAEVILGQKYRRFTNDGHILAGSFYYLESGLKEKNMPKLGKILGIIAAILCISGAIGGGIMFQSNQSISIISSSLNLEGSSRFILIILITILIGMVLIGGIVRISKLTEKIVPFMAVIYVISCIVILAINSDKLLSAISFMFHSAFQNNAIYGGIIGAIIQGIKRSAFSNEAGFGSAPIAHAAARTTEPAREGIIALLEPFIDTVIICFMTGIVIVVTGAYQNTDINDGILITRDAFATVSNWFPYILSLMVFLFAFSTMLTYSYYGQQAWLYLTKGKGIRICHVMFMLFVFIGGVVKLGIVIDFADILFLSMAVPNLIGMYILGNVIKNEIESYVSRLKEGKFEALRKKNMSKK